MPAESMALADSAETDWQRLAANEWYELHELKLSEKEWLICTALHKTDAQLGIGVTVHIARAARQRGFKFLRMEETVPTKKQKAMIDAMLPDGRVLELYGKIEYFSVEPQSNDNLTDVESFSEIPLDTDEEKAK